MRTLILYYSYTGHSRSFAEELSKNMDADIEEIKTVMRPGTLSAYLFGSLAAVKQQSVPIQPIQNDVNLYDNFILVAPVWANNPSPAFNSVLEILPTKKNLDIYLISGSGRSNKEKVLSHISKKGFMLSGYHDIKQSTI